MTRTICVSTGCASSIKISGTYFGFDGRRGRSCGSIRESPTRSWQQRNRRVPTIANGANDRVSNNTSLKSIQESADVATSGRPEHELGDYNKYPEPTAVRQSERGGKATSTTELSRYVAARLHRSALVDWMPTRAAVRKLFRRQHHRSLKSSISSLRGQGRNTSPNVMKAAGCQMWLVRMTRPRVGKAIRVVAPHTHSPSARH